MRNELSGESRVLSLRVILQLILFILVVPLLPLLITARWNWWEAWVYAGVNILGFVISRALAARQPPDLLQERAKFSDHEDAAAWDKVLAPLVGLGGGLIPLVAGLDAFFGWSPDVPIVWELVFLLIFLAGYTLGAYALVKNRFFSGMVRIQEDRGHQVVSEGPYRWMRHPGYAGALLSYLSAPAILDSLWAYLPAGLLAVLLVLRTRLEDETLSDELDGYDHYTHTVRYRLFPGLW